MEVLFLFSFSQPKKKACYCPANVYIYKISSQLRKMLFQVSKMGTEDYFLFYFFGTKVRMAFLNIYNITNDLLQLIL